jgi:branched-chain amino acid aminotransferase
LKVIYRAKARRRKGKTWRLCAFARILFSDMLKSMRGYIFFNGDIIAADEKLVGAGSRGLRYGEGVFETIRYVNGRAPLLPYHYERLMQGLQTLQFEVPAHFTASYILAAIEALCRKNELEQSARVRLNVCRGEEKETCVIMETMPIPEGHDAFNEKGWKVDIYGEAKKSCDALSNLKSNNYLPYIMAAGYAKSRGLNDCLVLNSYERICDSSIANVFWVKNKQVFTPPLSEGCIAGVMRRYVIEKLREAGMPLEEKICTKQKLLQADEVFLTNALFGARWVEEFREKKYINKLSAQLYKQIVKPLFFR